MRACEEFYKILQAGLGLQLLKTHRSNSEEEELDSGESHGQTGKPKDTLPCVRPSLPPLSRLQIELLISCELHVIGYKCQVRAFYCQGNFVFLVLL